MARTRASAWLVCFCLLHLVAGDEMLSAPCLPPAFKMNVKCEAWFLKEPRYFTVAYASKINRLYVCNMRQGGNLTKLYDFDNDVLYEWEGDEGPVKVTKEIPESEKHDPCIPLSFHRVDGRVHFDPHSIIGFKRG
ncbi:uncharacterized protein LOC144107988 [Amblyomma americanum]